MTSIKVIKDLSEKLYLRWASTLIDENSTGDFTSLDDDEKEAWEDLACFILHDGFSEELKQSRPKAKMISFHSAGAASISVSSGGAILENESLDCILVALNNDRNLLMSLQKKISDLELLSPSE